MGLIRKSLFVISIILITLPLLSIFSSISLVPQEPNLGFISNNIISVIIGFILLILIFLSWNKERKMMKRINTRKSFGNKLQQIPSHALRRAEAQEKARRRAQEAEAIRKNYAMQMKAVSKKYETA